MTIETSLKIRWKVGPARGYTDVFPLEWFEGAGRREGGVHEVQSARGRRYRAKCDINVRGKRADLDYEPYVTFNSRQGMELGVLRLHFSDPDRMIVSRAEWKDMGTSGFAPAEVRFTEFELPPFGRYRPGRKSSAKVMRPRRERPGQRKFRTILKVIYGGRCCITGCNVGEALDGAHIQPYMGPSFDHPQNGLLLRRDLHALFDAGLLTVEPASRRIHFDPRVRVFHEYRNLDGRTLLEPAPPHQRHRPSRRALQLRWSQL